METASEKSVSQKMLIIIMAIYFLHVVPTEQRLNFKLYYKTQSKDLGRIKCTVSINPMLQEDVSLLTYFLNVFFLLVPSVKIRVQNSLQCCRGTYRWRAWSQSSRSPQSRQKHMQESRVARERGNKGLGIQRTRQLPWTEISKGSLHG